MNQLTKTSTVIAWICRIAAAVILFQTLFFKFTAAPESVYIFTKVGLEPWGRIGSGIAELIAAILILLPRTTWIGAGLALPAVAPATLTITPKSPSLPLESRANPCADSLSKDCSKFAMSPAP